MRIHDGKLCRAGQVCKQAVEVEVAVVRRRGEAHEQAAKKKKNFAVTRLWCVKILAQIYRNFRKNRNFYNFHVFSRTVLSRPAGPGNFYISTNFGRDRNFVKENYSD